MNRIENIHARDLPVAASHAQSLLRSLGTRDNPMWPWPRWPAMRFKDGLAVGAHGGHVPIRYRIETIEPQRIQFRFTAPRGIEGIHAFAIEATGEASCRLTHTMRIQATGPARLSWPLLFRPLHDALLEDALDRAEAWAHGTGWQPRQLTLHVRMLRVLARWMT
jgi:hypothetical protein